MKYTLIDLDRNYAPDELLDQIPEEVTVVGVLGIDLEHIEDLRITVVNGYPQITLHHSYEGIKLPSDAVKVDVTYSGENYNAVWYVKGELPRAWEFKIVDGTACKA